MALVVAQYLGLPVGGELNGGHRLGLLGPLFCRCVEFANKVHLYHNNEHLEGKLTFWLHLWNSFWSAFGIQT